ncbi:phenylalanine--tRNA ligase beta subunit [Siccirubricoccus deserti]|uniref:Phenylalanine--tRNA ligase beta subunit n=1 Tax=Siccirubricoccus deserti TaxID=2013562 RepID=A0A9X0R3H1_9PROT|nr:phenylalanine--tRNA ligase subunit beta [Siccirubricoccus deserti]MBC4018856.1 phenylalanine--tRNA ligase subunit beta [Siccirubricoccus deserti]GGC68926.1 phenylalanine--tRNA ligase beta subunit [Siccirubricoccus deserti]
MKFTLSWLKAHLETEASLDEILTVLNRIGLEVEGVEDRGAALAAFRIAKVVEATQHPNADRLRALKVDPGDGNLLSVVCGAPNARAGMKGVVALPGAFIPGTGITLKKGEIRGMASEAMMLSAREMGLGEDHSGIVDLPADAPLGESYVRWAGLDDPVIEISVTPNRGDALSVQGVARDLAAAGLGRLKPLERPAITPAYPSPLRWEIADERACDYVLGRAIRGVRNGPSPKWLQDLLVAIGQRPINALVDVTNLYTYGLGRPLHVFDVAKVKGSTLTMRMAREGESLAALNGKSYALTPEDGIIADETGPEALGGIIGGAPTGCDETTTEVFIECALFDPVRIALSGRRHDIRTDARARFERGVDPALPRLGLELATWTIMELCGGEPSEVVAAGEEPRWQRSATLRFERLAGLGGADVPADEAVGILERLGFTVQARDAARVTVAVPSWRNDIAGAGALDQHPSLSPERARAAAEGCAEVEPEADLVEEVLRIRGLDQVPPVSLPVAGIVPPPALTPKQSRAVLARRVLAARGMLDCVSFGFMEAKVAARFGETPAVLRLENPIAADLDQMRPTPVASLLLAASRNAARGWPDVALSELGAAYRDPTPEGQLAVAAGVRAGHTPRHWAEPSRPFDAMDAKGDVLAVLAALGVPMAALQVTADAPGFYHPGRSGVVRQGPKTVLATFGEIHPQVRGALDLSGPAVGFEVFLDAIPEPKRRKRGAPDLPAFQPLRRDFAFLVDATVPSEAVLRAARGADKALVTDVALFDCYAGDKLPEGKVSLAIQVTLQPREATLTDAEIETVAAKIVAAVGKATGAVLR